jgi:anaerobic nitric oxide reductase flavorubredoxin
MNRKIVEGVHWVGFVDWNIRDFHGYVTDRGSTYNSYLILDREPALVDTVKAPYAADLLRNVSELMNPADLRWVVCNHAEPDHSGALPAVMAAAPNATLVCDQKCKDVLGIYYDTAKWKFKIVKTGDSLSLGARTLEFIETPMTHWPESMATWIPQDRLAVLHGRLRPALRDERAVRRRGAGRRAVLRGEDLRGEHPDALHGAGDEGGGGGPQLDPAIICPSHGVVWRARSRRCWTGYDRWDVCAPVRKVVVMYDTMWKSTEAMAEAIVEGAIAEGGPAAGSEAVQRARQHRHGAGHGNPRCGGVRGGLADAQRHADAGGGGRLDLSEGPEAHAHKAGFAFGSYGWGRGGPEEVEHYLQAMKIELLRPVLKLNYKPSKAGLDECREAGRLLARQALKVCPAWRPGS